MLTSIASGIASGIALAFLVAPGFLYTLRRETSVPAREVSAFRETIRLLCVSLLCFTASALLFGLAQLIFSSPIIDIAALIQNPNQYFETHYGAVARGTLTFVALSSLIGVIAADPRWSLATVRLRQVRILAAVAGPNRAEIRPQSSWYQVMHAYDGHPGPIYVGAHLEDGTFVAGYLSSFSVSPEDVDNRDLVLHSPIALRTTDGEMHELGNQFTVLSSKRIVRLDVTHIAPPA